MLSNTVDGLGDILLSYSFLVEERWLGTITTPVGPLSVRYFSHTMQMVVPFFQLPNGPSKYKLVALISHMGSNTACGHYVAHIFKDGKWVFFNDEKVICLYFYTSFALPFSFSLSFFSNFFLSLTLSFPISTNFLFGIFMVEKRIM